MLAKVPQLVLVVWSAFVDHIPRLFASVFCPIRFLFSEDTIMQRFAATVLIATRRVTITNARANGRITTPLMRYNSSATTRKQGPQDVKPFERQPPQDWAAPVVTYEEVKTRTMDPPPVCSPTGGVSRSNTI
jgi:hypothetical protein